MTTLKRLESTLETCKTLPNVVYLHQSSIDEIETYKEDDNVFTIIHNRRYEVCTITDEMTEHFADVRNYIEISKAIDRTKGPIGTGSLDDTDSFAKYLQDKHDS